MNMLRPARMGCVASMAGTSILLFALAGWAPGAHSQASAGAAQTFGPENPFYASSTLPFHAPAFDKIKDSDYQPAIDAGMAGQLKEVEAIANSSAPPTFDNTIVALEKSGRLLDRAMEAFNCVTGANTDDALEKVQEYEAPRLAATNDAITLNPKLFARIKAVYDERASLGLDPESLRLLEWDYREFVHAGANLSPADREKLKKLNEEDSTLENAFQTKLLAAAKAGAYSTDNGGALAGLSQEQLAAAEQAAQGRKQKGWVVPLQNTTQQPILTDLTDRATRQAIFENSWNRAERGNGNDTRATIARLAQLRAEKAALLGFPNYAGWVLTDQMAKTPQAAIDFVNALTPAATAKAATEAKDIQALIDKQESGKQNGGFQLEPWDWEFYSEQVRKAKYDLDESEIKPYFELNNVLENGVFYAANQLYGITFKERHDLPVWQPDVRVFEVFDADGKPLALIYFDYFKRDNKNGGAWMDNLVQESKLLGTLPVVYNVANFEKPAPGQPALLTFDDVTTMFHEFGHALNGMFADTEYPSLSGTQTARDFVEFPSQFNEHWASFPAVFAHYAHHYKTGAPMPADLVAKIKKSRTFNQGYMLTEILAAAKLDLDWHTLAADAPLEDPDTFEKQALDKSHLWIEYVPPRYRSSYFLHIWANGYAAGYYAYLWTEMLDDAAYQWFQDHGGMTRANGGRFRKMVLSRGNTEDLEQMYDAWLGGKPSIEPMLKNRGLVEQTAP
ncbi:MAG TPA: M3 family metallopeptidase [Terracidiphilus sp.]|nr:M3 family metallopeptidase [Terracidiphilus sp.]